MGSVSRVRSGAWRSRWAAVGAATAVTLGAGGMIAVDAASSDPSSTVTVQPTRILDGRKDVPESIGPFVSGVSQQLQVTGAVPTQPPGDFPAVDMEVVPAGATAVILNATVVKPSTEGFLSIRPGDATGDPATSNINWAAGGANIANSVTVQLPASGQIDIFVNGTVGSVLVDVAGYMLPATAGPAGPTGPAGARGPAGADGTDGAVRYAKVDADAAAAALLSGVGVAAVDPVIFSSSGVYIVSFTDSVAGCGWLATHNDNDNGTAASGVGVTVERGLDNNSLWVRTFATTTGSPAAPHDTDGFTVQVIC